MKSADRIDGAGSTSASRRDELRAELAELLDRDVSDLTDDARFGEELALDSLAMMSLSGWMETHGVHIGPGDKRPTGVGDLLSLIDTAAAHGIRLSIKAADGQGFGPVRLPRPPEPPPADPLAPKLESSLFRLVPLQPDDTPLLYELAVRPENCFRWRYRGTPPSPERFTEELWNHALVQYTVRRKRDNRLIGHVVAYGADRSTSHVYVGGVFQPEHTRAGHAAEMIVIFARYLFQVLPLRKIYLEIPEFNWSQVSSGEGKYFRKEGVLAGHVYYAGRYWDQYICAIYPDLLRNHQIESQGKGESHDEQTR